MLPFIKAQEPHFALEGGCERCVVTGPLLPLRQPPFLAFPLIASHPQPAEPLSGSPRKYDLPSLSLLPPTSQPQSHPDMGPPCPSFPTRQVLHSLAADRSLRPYLPREGRNDALAVTGASPQPGTLLGQPGRAQDPPPASSVEAPQPGLCACEDPGALFSLSLQCSRGMCFSSF